MNSTDYEIKYPIVFSTSGVFLGETQKNELLFELNLNSCSFNVKAIMDDIKEKVLFLSIYLLQMLIISKFALSLAKMYISILNKHILVTVIILITKKMLENTIQKHMIWKIYQKNH